MVPMGGSAEARCEPKTPLLPQRGGPLLGRGPAACTHHFPGFAAACIAWIAHHVTQRENIATGEHKATGDSLPESNPTNPTDPDRAFETQAIGYAALSACGNCGHRATR